MQFTITPNIQQNLYHKNSPNLQFTGSIEGYCKALDNAFKKGNGGLSDKERTFLTDEFMSLTEDIMTDERLLGKGYRGKVYQLNNKYAIKILNRFMEIGKAPEAVFEFGENLFKPLHTYFGEAIATIGNTVKFLHNIGKHTPAGVPEAFHYHFSADIEKIHDYYLNQYLPKFAKVPQESYDAIAMDCARLNKIEKGDEHYKIDIENPNNIVLCGKKLLLIDDLDETPHRIPNTTGTLLDLLLYRATHQVESPKPGRRLKEYQTIFKKIITAAEKANLDYIDSMLDLMAFEHVIKNCNPKSPYKVVYDELRFLQSNYPDINERLAKLNEIFEREFSI